MTIGLRQSQALVGLPLRLLLDWEALCLGPTWSDTPFVCKTERETFKRRTWKSADSRVATPWERETT